MSNEAGVVVAPASFFAIMPTRIAMHEAKIRKQTFSKSQ
jgi:hypothetical protein